MLLLFLGFILGTFGSWIAAHFIPPPSVITNWYVNALDRYANWRAKRSILSAQKRIQSLELQVEIDKRYIQNTTSFVASIAKDIFNVIWFAIASLLLFFLFPISVFVDFSTKIVDMFIHTDSYEPEKMILAVQQILDDPTAISFITKIIIVLGVVLNIITISRALILFRRLLRFSFFEQYEKNTKLLIEDLRNYILENQQQPTTESQQ